MLESFRLIESYSGTKSQKHVLMTQRRSTTPKTSTAG